MSSKRRSGPAGSPGGFASTPEPKRRKRNDDTHFPDEETVETTSDIGLRLVNLLKKSQDKTGRNVAIHFLDLPSRSDYPDYFQQIPMPLSLNMVENRLQNGEYNNLEKLESDLKRMIQNAKDYNSSRSEIFDDAERIRKALSNFMPKHNPSYLNPDYRAYPTPVPQTSNGHLRESSASTAGTSGPEKVKLVFSNTAARRRQSQATSVDEDNDDEEEEEEDDNDDGEVDIKSSLLQLLDDLSTQEDAVNFESKPPKKEYPDYYKVIQRPTSITDVRGMANRGRIKDWNSLAREVRLIWDNAKEYNETGSAIFEMAESLESWFEQKVQAFGAQPRILPRLSLSQPKPKQLKLTMGSSTPTPNLAGGTIDSESLRRQREEMGQALSRANRASSRNVHLNGTTSVAAAAGSTSRRSTSTAEVNEVAMSVRNGSVKAHSTVSHDSIPATMPTHIGQLPTPAIDAEPQAVFTATASVNGTRVPELHSNQANVRPLHAESENPVDRKYRDPGKGIADAVLHSVVYMTNPDDPNDPKWKLTRYASPNRTQTSHSIYLPLNHCHLRLIPALTEELRSRRRHKLCVTHDWHLVQPNERVPGAYDVKLVPGGNTVAVDLIADLKDGQRKEYAPSQMQFDFERITFYFYLVQRTES